MNKISIGDRIKYLLDDQGKQAKDLAEYIGVTQAAMSNYLNNKRDINVNLIPGIANFLNVSTDYLLANSDIKDIGFNKRQRKLILYFESLSREKQDALLRLLDNSSK